jgi:hypothetical protein
MKQALHQSPFLLAAVALFLVAVPTQGQSPGLKLGGRSGDFRASF